MSGASWGYGVPYDPPSSRSSAAPAPLESAGHVVRCPDCGAPEGTPHYSGNDPCAQKRRCYACVVARVAPPKVGEMPRCERCRAGHVRMRDFGVHRG
jgi:hypothetical protein